ncbi:MAG: lipoate--protein ligase [Muribaculaceae bacterium]
MKHVVLPSDTPYHRLPFYLAMEEWVARELPADEEYFFAWQVHPTVICGRNQEIDKEVDLQYCRRENIDVCRRKSGGGCVFADMNNIMFSYITPSTDVETTFAHYTSMVVEMLRSLGYDAESTGRNDVAIKGRKVAGNAFYHVPGRSIVHGTMLYDTDPVHITHAITPSRAKLESKKVTSVASHITTLRQEGIDMSCDAFRDYAIAHLTDGDPIVLTPADVAEIEKISEEYLTSEHLYGKASVGVHRHRARIDGVGEFVVDYTLGDDNTISSLNLMGDFFPLTDIDSALLSKVIGSELSAEALAKALEGIKVSSIISGLDNVTLIKILTSHGD